MGYALFFNVRETRCQIATQMKLTWMDHIVIIYRLFLHYPPPPSECWYLIFFEDLPQGWHEPLPCLVLRLLHRADPFQKQILACGPTCHSHKVCISSSSRDAPRIVHIGPLSWMSPGFSAIQRHMSLCCVVVVIPFQHEQFPAKDAALVWEFGGMMS